MTSVRATIVNAVVGDPALDPWHGDLPAYLSRCVAEVADYQMADDTPSLFVALTELAAAAEYALRAGYLKEAAKPVPWTPEDTLKDMIERSGNS